MLNSFGGCKKGEDGCSCYCGCCVDDEDWDEGG